MTEPVWDEIDSTYRVYQKVLQLQARTYVEEQVDSLVKVWQGRVQDDEIVIRPDSEGGVNSWEIWVMRYNVIAEFKHEEHAKAWSSLTSDPTEVVARNSKREHELRSYGLLLLPA